MRETVKERDRQREAESGRETVRRTNRDKEKGGRDNHAALLYR